MVRISITENIIYGMSAAFHHATSSPCNRPGRLDGKRMPCGICSACVLFLASVCSAHHRTYIAIYAQCHTLGGRGHLKTHIPSTLSTANGFPSEIINCYHELCDHSMIIMSPSSCGEIFCLPKSRCFFDEL